MKKVELLAPAGSYESFLGAIHAGADAMYLGGHKFGARAYADNFTAEEVCRAIRYAHLYGRKVYLTLNTLVKTREFDEIFEYMKPFYEAGLDGVIIQDLGVFAAVGEWFPGLERHVSTQMTLTGALGAAYLKELGATRVVPARELSIAEIREMKAEAEIEIETFIHGAICYCYSGQCLFSSVIGGRSGNRGRCAQPCRLPYRMEGNAKEQYPLSLKDMCTIELLPELIEAGIDSFKIEGRMKSPEYAAGVTAIYRKYIDRYYENPPELYKVEKEDLKKLGALYIRSEISEGYYHRHNGKDMITLESPSYAGRDDALAEQIRKTYLEGDFRLPVQAKADLRKGEPVRLTLCYEKPFETKKKEGSPETLTVTAEGEVVQEAQKQPLSEEAVRKQLNKFGNTAFRAEVMEIEAEEGIFLPVKALNELRRKACERLEEEIEAAYGLRYQRDGSAKDTASIEAADEYPSVSGKDEPCIHVSVLTKEQAEAAVLSGVERIYVSSDLCIDRKWVLELKQSCRENTELYLALPYIIRQRDKLFLKEMEELLAESVFSGVLVRNQEEICWLRGLEAQDWKKHMATDANLYIWNPKACEVFERVGNEHYIPYELNIHEIRELTERTTEQEWAMSVYGRIPMMITANCVARTNTGCRMQNQERGQNQKQASKHEKETFGFLTDRYKKQFPVYFNCSHCYNVIYNSLPLSLHQNMETIKNAGIQTFRLDFTTENGKDVDRIIRYFNGELRGEGMQLPYDEYTKGHLKRGVE